MTNVGWKANHGDKWSGEYLAAGAAGAGFYVNDVKVVGAQGAVLADVTPAADGTAVGTAFNTLLARLRAHGLIATA